MSDIYKNKISNYITNYDGAIKMVKSISTQIDNIKKSFSTAKGDMITNINSDLGTIISNLESLKTIIEKAKEKTDQRAKNSDTVYEIAIKDNDNNTTIQVESDGLIHKRITNKRIKEGGIYYKLNSHYIINLENMIAGNCKWSKQEESKIKETSSSSSGGNDATFHAGGGGSGLELFAREADGRTYITGRYGL